MAKSKNGHTNGASGASELPAAGPTDDLGAVALPSSADDAVDAVDAGQRLSVKKTLRGRRILVTGTTGFLGKVFVSMLLHEHSDIDHLYLLIRSSSQQGAENRFYNEIAASGAFEPIRERHGADTLEWLQSKITILCGDITDELLGVEEDQARAISEKLDLIVNSAGLTNFNPNLRHALEINTLSHKNLLAFSRLGGSRAKVMHVSTCFVAGRVDGQSYEVVPDETHYPNYDDLQVPYDPEREVADCFAMVEHVEALAEDQERTSLFTRQARDLMRKRNLNPEDDEHLQRVLDEVKKKWIRDQLSQDGRQRADHWGWVNIYTYTKSLGERLLAKNAGDVDFTIFRPAVIESSLSFPVEGWNEGINTTAPIIYLSYKGHRFIPTRDEVSLDVIPVDTVAGAMLAICAALIEGRAKKVYHCGSSHLAPLSMNRLIELTTLAVRKVYDRRSRMPQWQKLVLKSLDSIPVAPNRFNTLSAPGLARAARGFGGLLKKVPTRQMGGVGKAIDVVHGMTRQAEKLATVGEKIFELFMPFIYENIYTFRCDNLLELRAQLVDEEVATYGCRVEDIDWRHYWIKVHVPGLDKHVFPQLEAKLRESNRDVYTFKDLVELFDSSTKNFADEVAFQHHAGGIVERYTYADVREHALRAANALRSYGAGPGTAVLLVSENRPQWGMAYFGILKAGGVAVPVDPDSNAEQIANLVASSRAQVVVMSNKVKYRLDASLPAALENAGVEPALVTLPQLFALALPAPDTIVDSPQLPETALVHPGADLASLIFTSGTTGVPKGVMLTHKNFAALLASLEGLFRIGDRDGFLSVLPLHHTFEFTAGFLMPFSKGSTVTYLEELSGEELRAAMTSTRVTSLIGVPALWQLLHRRIEAQLDEQGPAIRWLFDQLVAFNRRLRDRTGMNFGPTLFAPIHAAFGNRMRYMISGGASLPEDVLKTFYGLGFNLYEGYGLTEAAPVLTVNRPDRGLLPGSVGQPLDGIEIEIRNPDKDGVGEIVARGDNVMLGYLDRPEDTERALEDGWLRTGDLGKLDRKGNLTIVGRSKEVIITSGGKNVYPDELEEIYGRCPDALELAVVGLPDGQGSERVAALVRPDVVDDATAEDIASVRQSIRDWIRVEGARVASHNRIQVLRFWDEEFPRTPTRKVKRKEVVAILERLVAADAENREDDSAAEEATWGWLDHAIAGLAGVDPATVAFGTHFQDDLGFDSLMVVELASILESRDLHVTTDQLSRVETVGQLRDLLDSPGTAVALAPRERSILDEVQEIRVPEPIANAGKGLLYAGQMWAYDDFYDVDVYGRGNIPYHNPNVIVVANHSSHLDMGLVKYALGDFGRDIRALAAADYFFSNTARKTYFKHFTNLIPVERSGSVETSLGPARQALQSGETLLMFPEGTRSTDGKLRPFRRGLGYLVAEQRVDILPVWIEGTYRALPKGQSLPSLTTRHLKVRIGKPVRSNEVLRELAEFSGTDLYQAISDRAHKAVEELSMVGHENDRDETVAPLFAELSEKFEQDQVDEQVTFYFTLGKVDDLKWTVIVDPENCDIRMGKPSGGQADCVVKTSPELFRKIVQESYIPSFDEFMDGTIKTNSPDLLMQFQSVFRLQG
jgi:long-chain acyl-CoA synthetase